MSRNHSKHLSWLLRHGANEAGLAMDAAGWARIADVLRVASINRDELDLAVRQNNKQRLQLDETRGRIRAAQGHSPVGTPVTREALEASWERFTGDGPIWHGTHVAAILGIAEAGILPGQRTHVHLAASVDSTVGKRAQVDVLLQVSALRLRDEGFEIFASPNGVLLVRSVPTRCITGLQAVSKLGREQEWTLRARLGLGGAPAS